MSLWDTTHSSQRGGETFRELGLTFLVWMGSCPAFGGGHPCLSRRSTSRGSCPYWACWIPSQKNRTALIAETLEPMEDDKLFLPYKVLITLDCPVKQHTAGDARSFPAAALAKNYFWSQQLGQLWSPNQESGLDLDYLFQCFSAFMSRKPQNSFAATS